jgi:hypothetical protein
MKWATPRMIHFDRVVSAWAILRFVDRDAEFIFLGEGEKADTDVVPFGMSGARLAAHDGNATTFARILDVYAIHDPALARLRAIVADVVDHVMHDQDRAGLAARDPHAGGLLALAEGIMLVSASDAECLARSLPLYDALYARLQAQIVLDGLEASPGASVLAQTTVLSDAARTLRAAKSGFSDELLAGALRDLAAEQR